MKFVLPITLLLISFNIFAGAGNTIKHCSGTVKVCDYSDDFTSCRRKPFTVMTHQLLHTHNDRILNESHSFSFFSNWLGDKDDYELVDFNDTHILYESDDFKLSVPYVSGNSLMFKEKIHRGDRNRRHQYPRWKVLCD